MTALEVFHRCLTFILSLRRHIWVWRQWAGWSHHGWSGLLAIVGLFYCVEYTVTTYDANLCVRIFVLTAETYTISTEKGTVRTHKVLYYCTGIFCTVQHYSLFVHLISWQLLGSDTSPIAYYTARGVRSVIRVVASQGKTMGLRNQRWDFAPELAIFAPKLGIFRYPKIRAIGGEIFGQYYLEAERRRAGNGLAKGSAEAQATRLRTHLPTSTQSKTKGSQVWTLGTAKRILIKFV